MIEPPMPSRGMNVMTWSMHVWRFLLSIRPRVGPGLTLTETSAGTIISLSRKPKTSATKQTPFRVTNASNDDTKRVYVRPGHISSVYGWWGPPSNLSIPDTNNKLYLEVAATGWVCLKFTLTESGDDTKPPTLTSVIVEYLVTMPADTKLVARLVLAQVVMDAGEITHIFQNVTSNLLHGLAFELYSYPDYWRQRIGPISPSL